jgi:hypothetical protein
MSSVCPTSSDKEARSRSSVSISAALMLGAGVFILWRYAGMIVAGGIRDHPFTRGVWRDSVVHSVLFR